MNTPEENDPAMVPPPVPADEAPASEVALACIPPDGDPVEGAIIRRHVLWSLSAGLIPVPLADIAAVTAIQIDALRQLAKHHGADYSEDAGKTFVAALTGGTLARMGASAIKAIPGVGSIVGGLTMAGLSAASTFAVCQVASRQLRTGKSLITENVERAKEAYTEALEKGKKFVQSLKERGVDKRAEALSETLTQLASLRDKGLLTPEEFEAKKTVALETVDV